MKMVKMLFLSLLFSPCICAQNATQMQSQSYRMDKSQIQNGGDQTRAFSDPLTIKGLTVNGTSKLNGNVTLPSNKNLTVGGVTTLSGTLSVASPATLSSWANIGGNLTVSGMSLLKDEVQILNKKKLLVDGGVAQLGGNTSVGGTFSVAGASTLSGNLTLGKNLIVGGPSTLSGNVTLASGKSLTVGGTSTFNDNVTVASGKSLTVGGISKLNGNVTIANGKSLTVGGVSTFNNNVTIASGKNLTVGGTSTFSGNVTIDLGKKLVANGSLTVLGESGFNDPATFYDTVTCESFNSLVTNGSLEANGSLTVAGASTFNNPVTFNDPATFNDSVIVAAGKNIVANGNVTVGGTSTFNDNVTMKAGKKLTANGKVVVVDTTTLRDTTITATSTRGLTVYGRSNFKGDVYIDGSKVSATGGVSDPLSLNTLTVQSSLTTDEEAAVSFGGDITVDGGTTISGLTTQCDTNINGTSDRGLTVYGRSTFNGLATFNDDVSISRLNVNSHILCAEQDINFTGTDAVQVFDLSIIEGSTMLMKLDYFGDVGDGPTLFGQLQLLFINGELKYPYIENVSYLSGYPMFPSVFSPSVVDNKLYLSLIEHETVTETTNGILFFEILMKPPA